MQAVVDFQRIHLRLLLLLRSGHAERAARRRDDFRGREDMLRVLAEFEVERGGRQVDIVRV